MDGLFGAYDVGVSADGKSVYVTGWFDDALAVFDRDTDTGALTSVSYTHLRAHET